MSRGFNVKMRQVACVKFYGKENGPIFIPPPPKKNGCSFVAIFVFLLPC